MTVRERVARALFAAMRPGGRWEDVPADRLELWGGIADAAIAAMRAGAGETIDRERAAQLLQAERDAEVERLGGWERVHASALLNNWIGGFTTSIRVLRGDEPRPTPGARS